MVVTESGMVSEVMAEDVNALLPMVVSVLGRVIVVSAVVSWNADSPMVVTLVGIVTDETAEF